MESMADSETFAIESGHGEEVIQWLNEEAKEKNLKYEARLYGHTIATKNFGEFEMFSWRGNVQVARKLIVRASKRFKIKVIEGSYKTKEKILHMKKSDYGLVRKGDKVIGHLEFEASRLGSGNWKIKDEERR